MPSGWDKVKTGITKIKAKKCGIPSHGDSARALDMLRRGHLRHFHGNPTTMITVRFCFQLALLRGALIDNYYLLCSYI